MKYRFTECIVESDEAIDLTVVYTVKCIKKEKPIYNPRINDSKKATISRDRERMAKYARRHR